MNKFSKTVSTLCELSEKEYVNPYVFLAWPEHLEIEQWYTSPELISIYGTPYYDDLSDSEKKRLSFYEAVNFFSLNIHGEKSLVEGLARQLYRKEKTAFSPYLHHFLGEENKHMTYFGGFCMRYAGKIYPDKKMVFPREYETGEEDFLFFAKAMIFEELVDDYNFKMASDKRLVSVVRQINAIHHREEVRHLAFGRGMVKHLFEQYVDQWSKETLAGIRAYLQQYILSTWKEYYNPSVYQDAGLKDPYVVQEKAFENDKCRLHRRKTSEKCIRFLCTKGILEEGSFL